MTTMLSTPLPLTGTDPAQARCRVWRIDLDQAVPEAARALLSPAEQARARRFVFDRDRQRFVAAHAALRELLAWRTGRPGAALDIAEGPFGKPALALADAPRFNLSHSQGIGVVALSDAGEVGVDVEAVRPMPDADAMARTYFAPSERAALARLAALDAGRAERAFFVCWTRKEACLKALGLGLQLATDSFEVGVDALEGAWRDVAIATPEGIERLRLRSFDGGPRAVGALALRTGTGARSSDSACAGTPASKAFA